MKKVLLSKFPMDTIVSAYSVLGEEESNRIIDDALLNDYGYPLNTEIEHEFDKENHPNEMYVYAYIEEAE